MSQRQSFARRAAEASDAAWRLAHPFVPSRAQLEEAMWPLVAELLAMDREVAADYVRASWSRSSVQSLALHMYKTARAEAAE